MSSRITAPVAPCAGTRDATRSQGFLAPRRRGLGARSAFAAAPLRSRPRGIQAADAVSRPRLRPRTRAVMLEGRGSGGAEGDGGASARDRLEKAAALPSAPGARRASQPQLSPLEAVVLDFNLGFTEKMLKVCKIFGRDPAKSAVRFAEVMGVATKIYSVWQWEGNRNTPEEKRKRGELLRNGIAQLGPVFVKMAQTLSTRPDIIGEEAATSLLVLQDQMGPFPTSTAMNIIREDLNWEGPIVMGEEGESADPDAPRPLFRKLSPAPIAAASIGQVYRGELMDGREVALKVQRPGMVQKIALDMYIVRQLLDWLEKSGYNGSEDLPIIVDEVGAAIFYELDYRQEAQNADDFTESLKMLEFVKVPQSIWDFTTRRVLVQEWINGRPMKALNIDEQREMVQMGVTCSATQLLRTGLVHADPHEGNMMYTDDGRLALLDFGLVCRVDNEKQEAMASCILDILNANWEGVADNLRIIGILPEQAAVWTNSKGEKIKFEAGTEGSWVDLTDADFKVEFRKAMSGGKGGDTKRNFTELVMDLTDLSGMYRFCLPPYMVFIIRSITTLDFCAVRTNCNMYEVAAPVAIWRALTPRTKSGIEALHEALLTSSGEINWERLEELASNDKKGKEAQLAQKAANSGKESDMTQHGMMDLLNELMVSPEGAAFRRVAWRASPKALIPPAKMRPAIIAGAQSAFKQTVKKLRVMNLLVLASETIQSQLLKREAECQVVEDSNGRIACRRDLDRRRIRVIKTLIKNKLASPAGLLTSLKLFAMMTYVAAAVMTSCFFEAIRYMMFRQAKFIFKTLSGGSRGGEDDVKQSTQA